MEHVEISGSLPRRPPHPQVIRASRRELAKQEALERIAGLAWTCPRLLPICAWGEIVGHAHGDGHARGLVIPWQRGSEALHERRECAISTFDGFLGATAASKYKFLYWSKAATTNAVANNWYDLWRVDGSQPAGAYGGAAFTAVQFSETTSGSILHGGNVSTDTKYLVWALSWVNSNTPTMLLTDRVLTYEACAFNAAANQAFTNVLAAQRYISTGDPGLLFSTTCQTVENATASAFTRIAYTDDAGNTGQLIPTTGPLNVIVSAAAPTSTLGARVVAPTTAGNTVVVSPFMPLAAGDTGVRKLEDFTTSAANTGTLCFVLHQPLAWMPLSTAGPSVDAGMLIPRALVPIIKDGACLSLFAYAVAANNYDGGGSGLVKWG